VVDVAEVALVDIEDKTWKSHSNELPLIKSSIHSTYTYLLLAPFLKHQSISINVILNRD